MLERTRDTSVPSIEISSPQEENTSFHLTLLELHDDARVAVLQRKDEIGREVQKSVQISPEVQKFREQREQARPATDREKTSEKRTKLAYLDQLKEQESSLTRILTFRGMRRHKLREEVLPAPELREREEQRHLRDASTQQFSFSRALQNKWTSRDTNTELSRLKIQHRVEQQKAISKDVISGLPDELRGGRIQDKTNDFLKKHGEIRNALFDQYQVYNALKMEIEHYLDREQLHEKPPLPVTQQWLTRMDSKELSQVYRSVSQEATFIKEHYKSMTGKSIDAMTKINTMNEITKKDFESLQKEIDNRATRQTLREDRDEIVQSTIADSTSPWARVKDMWTYGNSTRTGGAATLDGKRVEELQKKL